MSIYHNTLVVGFVSTDRTIVYLKQDEVSREYAVKVRLRGENSAIMGRSQSLAQALVELSTHIKPTHTWRPL